MGWIGVDLDGVLAEYHGWRDGAIGAPIPAMIERVQRWLAEGKDVRIFTARAGILDAVSPESGRRADQAFAAQQAALIEAWCEQHIGRRLPVTASKDFMTLEIWDDRCVQVQPNQGAPIDEHLRAENERLRTVLKSLEWLEDERTRGWAPNLKYCPSCRMPNHYGHLANCSLAAALRSSA